MDGHRVASGETGQAGTAGHGLKGSLALVVILCAVMLGIALPVQQVGAYTQCYRGTDKGITHDSRGYHHYVEFQVNLSTSDQYWYIQSKPWNYPFSASLWSGYYQHHHDQGGRAIYKEIGYNWPGNAPDPYRPSDWIICHR